MKPKFALWMLCFHSGLLVLASTRFSVLTWIWGNPAWRWDYFQYCYKNGWGYQYQSDYSAVVVLTYIAAYSAGVAGYGMAWKRVPSRLSGLAAILSALGLISFLIEGSHWLVSHHLSWIASCPAASLLLAGVVIVLLGRSGGKPAKQAAAPNAGSASAPPASVS
jgi:hypothetical protein